jgi:hypothetical protein
MMRVINNIITKIQEFILLLTDLIRATLIILIIFCKNGNNWLILRRIAVLDFPSTSFI